MFDIVEPVSAFAIYSKIAKPVNSVPNRNNKRKKGNKNNSGGAKKQKIEKGRQINGNTSPGKQKKKIKQVRKIIGDNKAGIIKETPKEKPSEIKINGVGTNTNNIKEKEVSVPKNTNKNDINEHKKGPEFVFKTPDIDSYREMTKNVKPIAKKQNIVKTNEKLIKPDLQKCSSGYFYIDNTDSVRTGEQMFSWILKPLEIKKFFRENWEKHPVILQRNCPKYYSNLLTCEDIDKALRKQQLYFTKNIDITSYTQKTGLRETHNPPGRATAPLVWDFYANGCSIRILNPQTFFPKIHALNAALQEYFGCFVGANVYLTPADSQGFAPHFDDIEAFVIQLEGEKMWKLYEPRNPGEILPRFSSGNFTEADLGKPIQEVLLKAGDMMYFPRGFIHQGVALGNKHSLHITLSMYQKNSWADLLETLLPAALKSAIEEDVSFREGLPMHFLSNLGLVHSDKKSEIRTNFLEKLQTLITKLVKFAPVDAAVDQLGKKFIHDCLPPFLRHDEKETTVFGDGERIANGVVHSQAEMCLASRIKLIRYNCIRMLREEETIRIYYSISNSKEYHEEEAQFLEIDEDLAPAVDALIYSYPEFITVEDLPIDDDIAKVQIASDLWENGILMTEEPLSYMSD